MENRVEGGYITVLLDSSLYSKDAIFKCLYWFGDKFHTEISVVDSKYKITLKPLEDNSTTDLDLYLAKLERDLIDFNLRDIVTKETKNIRDLLIAKAFSSGEFDEQVPGEVSDPVGFDASNIKTEVSNGLEK